MHRKMLCLGLSENQFGVSDIEQIALFKEAGFEAFFAGWTPGKDLLALRRAANEQSMFFQSVHAPFGRMADMWTPSDRTEQAVNELLQCVRETASAGVEIVVVHAFIGFRDHTPTQFGLDNFALVVDEAERLGVKIAFENVEGEEYLAALMAHFEGRACVGFCWDTGHELCYNHGKDQLALYGDRLLCTHLNDNLGVRDFSGEITWLDDLHLLPFDGIADWQGIARRLNACGFDGPLTFELCRLSKPGRHDNDLYERMPLKAYIALAYARACRATALLLRDSGRK